MANVFRKAFRMRHGSVDVNGGSRSGRSEGRGAERGGGGGGVGVEGETGVSRGRSRSGEGRRLGDAGNRGGGAVPGQRNGGGEARLVGGDGEGPGKTGGGMDTANGGKDEAGAAKALANRGKTEALGNAVVKDAPGKGEAQAPSQASKPTPSPAARSIVTSTAKTPTTEVPQAAPTTSTRPESAQTPNQTSKPAGTQTPPPAAIPKPEATPPPTANAAPTPAPKPTPIQAPEPAPTDIPKPNAAQASKAAPTTQTSKPAPTTPTPKLAPTTQTSKQALTQTPKAAPTQTEVSASPATTSMHTTTSMKTNAGGAPVEGVSPAKTTSATSEGVSALNSSASTAAPKTPMSTPQPSAATTGALMATPPALEAAPRTAQEVARAAPEAQKVSAASQKGRAAKVRGTAAKAPTATTKAPAATPQGGAGPAVLTPLANVSTTAATTQVRSPRVPKPAPPTPILDEVPLDLSRVSCDEEAAAYGAADSDGMRAARSRLSLDDANIRGRPTVGFRRIQMDTPEMNPLSAMDMSYDVEGVVLIDPKRKLPVQVGTCGKAGWEPVRGQRRVSLEYLRKENQDAYLAVAPFMPAENQMLFAVFDGHGAEGRKVSHVVRSTFVKVLRDSSYDGPDYLLTPLHETDTETHRQNVHRVRVQVLHKAFRAAEDELRQPHRDIEHMYSGTTGVVTWMIGADMYCAWTGDSRAVMGSSLMGDRRYRASELSHDHKPSRSDERKRVKSKGGRIARWKKDTGPLRVWIPTDWIPGLAMTRSMGDTILTSYGVYPIPEVTYVRLTASESFIILASDGVWEFMTSQEVVDFVGKRRAECVEPSDAAEALVREAVRRWQQSEIIIDDTTAIVIYLSFTGQAKQPASIRKGFFSFARQVKGTRPSLVQMNGQLTTFNPANDT